jgi:hypothetical protein
MQFRLVLLGAHTLFANVGVFTPAAAAKLCLFADSSTDGTSLQQIRDDVPGVLAPSVHYLYFFPDLLEFVVA